MGLQAVDRLLRSGLVRVCRGQRSCFESGLSSGDSVKARILVGEPVCLFYKAFEGVPVLKAWGLPCSGVKAAYCIGKSAAPMQPRNMSGSYKVQSVNHLFFHGVHISYNTFIHSFTECIYHTTHSSTHSRNAYIVQCIYPFVHREHTS